LYRRAAELGTIWKIPGFETRVDIDYSSAMRTRAGVADLVRFEVRLNLRLMERHPEQVDETLVHELAHIAAVIICGHDIDPHGPEWQSLMRAAGYRPDRTHTLDVSDLQQERRRYLYLHRCESCGAYRISRRVVRMWECIDCNPGKLAVWRAPDTPAGRKKLLEIVRAPRKPS
jgi:SprT protein